MTSKRNANVNVNVKSDKLRVILINYPYVLCLNINYSSKYQAQSLDCEIFVTVTCIYFGVLILYKNGVYIKYFSRYKANYWTVKCKST